MPLASGYLSRPFAHRALHGAGRPENSLSAVQAAVAAGYAIEIDVQLTADGAAAVFHDDDLPRLTGAQGCVRDKTLARLRALPLLGGGGEGAPDLPATLEAIAGRVPLVVEIKDQTGAYGPTDGRLEAATAAALSGYAGPVAIMSFNPHAVAWFRDHAPVIPRGLVAYDYADEPHIPADHRADLAAMTRFDELGCDFFSYGVGSFPAPAAAALRARGVPALCWTVRSPEQADFAYRHADQITFEGYAPSAAPKS